LTWRNKRKQPQVVACAERFGTKQAAPRKGLDIATAVAADTTPVRL